jgi:hypothetical protein
VGRGIGSNVEVTVEIDRVSLLPNSPAVYALFGGRDRGLHVAYVGVADKLRRRIEEHLVKRGSSVALGYSAAGLNPDKVTELRWWTNAEFVDRSILEAAEMVAFDVLDPALRSRGAIAEQARKHYLDPIFQERFRAVFLGPSTGHLILPTLQDALDRIASLQRQIDGLAQRLDGMEVGK